MNYQPIKEYNTKIRFDLFKLENTVNDVKIIIYEKTESIILCNQRYTNADLKCRFENLSVDTGCKLKGT